MLRPLPIQGPIKRMLCMNYANICILQTKIFQMKLKFFFLLLFSACFAYQGSSQIFEETKAPAPAKKPAAKKDKKDKVKAYGDLITKEAVTDSGLIITHQLDRDYYFEIPRDLMNKEMLVVTRISGFVKNLNFGGAGVKSRPQQVIRFQEKGKRVLLRSVSYNSVANFEDPIYESVRNNNFEPVISVFDIAAYNKDSSAVVIKVNPLFETDVEMIGAMSQNQRRNFGIRGLAKDKSFINGIKSFPQNIEVRHILTYTGTKLPDNQVTGTMSVELNQSIIMLPENKWVKRLYDDRVGYFSVQQTDYSSDAQRADRKRYITRWRLEPSDWDAYERGELVEPVKPIIYYIDPSTPEKWRPWIANGVNVWQSAFEKAGFKNAIYAMDAPSKEEDPDWSPEDVRYSVIRYVSTDIQNAMGPHVHDPRTGEILESDIIWYHNVMNLLRNWYLVQTAAINEDARGVNFDDAVMGSLIQFVAAHEVGHTLGLPHNMGSSVSYPVDSLRSPEFTKRMGTAPSIMDYARFNYVAQPGDGDVGLMPGIGPYDDWSIEFGYRLNRGVDDPAADALIVNEWVKERADDPNYRYGRQQGRVIDPSSQTEDLGDDAIYASELGLKNLKRIVPNLIEWSYEEGKNYSQLGEMYNQVVGQFRRYIGHVGNNVGGVYEYYKTADQGEAIYSHVAKEKQERAVDFLVSNVLNTPDWLLDKSILDRISNDDSLDPINSLQSYTIGLLLRSDRIDRMVENELINGADAYTVSELFTDIESNVYSDIEDAGASIPRKNLHRVYVSRLKSILNSADSSGKHDELSSYALASLHKLHGRLDGADASNPHVLALKNSIKKILDL